VWSRLVSSGTEDAERNWLDRELSYVDVGGCLPFDYSNTAWFDRCRGERWGGAPGKPNLCVEPNPSLNPMLQAYRRCHVLPFCVSDKDNPDHTFKHRDGRPAFVARCVPLNSLLGSAGSFDVDFLNVDVENQEMAVFEPFPFHDFNIKYVVVEVGKGVNSLRVDTVFLSNGYVKVSFLGRDAVYAKISALRASKGHLPGWELLGPKSQDTMLLPHGWKEFHYRVVEDELKQEEYHQARIRREVILKKQGHSQKDALLEAKKIVDEAWAKGEQMHGGYLPDEPAPII